MKPIQLFLVVNLIFFIAAYHNLYSLDLYNYITFRPFINYDTKQIVSDIVAKQHTTLPEYTAVFNEKMKGASKAYIFAFIPFYGILFGLLFLRKKNYFVEHLVFATHFMSFVLVMLFVGGYVAILPWRYLGNVNSPDFDNIYSSVIRLIVAIYAGFALRRFYKANLFYTIIVAAIVGFFFFWPIQYYRMGLFYKITSIHEWFGH